MPEERLLLIGCGILSREVCWLVRKNGWPVDTTFLDSSLHVDLGRLGTRLTATLREHARRRTIVCYGTCHPLMDDILAEAGALRTEGQNCAEMLLGHQAFADELQQGAFFLLEDWARTWPQIIAATFRTTNLAVVREIFHLDRRYLLALRTPLSGDFAEQARDAGLLVDLPVRWRDVSLDHLEAVLSAAIERRNSQAE
jgi:hypothetical protein